MSTPSSHLWTALRFALTFALLGLIFTKVSARAIADALMSAVGPSLLAGLALGLVVLALKAIRWRFILARVGVPCTPREAVRSYLGGLAVGLVTPGRVGEVARSMYLPHADRRFVTGAALADKLLDVSVVLTAGAIGCAVQGLRAVAVGLVGAAVALAGLTLLPARHIARVTALVPVRLVRSVIDDVSRARLSPSTVALGLLQAIVTFGVVLVQFHLFLRAFVDAPFEATLFVLPLSILSNLVPITISGVGVREWASILLFGRYGVPGAVAVNVALLLYFSNSLGPGVLGTFVAPRRAAVAEANR